MLSIRRPSAARTVTGLDIEPGAIRAVQAHAEAGRLVVTATACAPLEPGIYRDGEVLDAEALAGALRALFEEHALDKRVRVGVANQRIVVRTLLLPAITDPKELATAVRFMAADELPIPIDQAVLDHHVLGLVDTPQGPRTKVLVVAARRAMIDTLLASIRAAGLRPEGIDLSAFALLRAAGCAGEGTALHLDIGGTVNLAVTTGGECVFTRVIGGGMETMATEIAERTGAPIAEARAALEAVRLDAAPAPAPRPRAEFVVPEPAPVAEPEPELESEPATEPALAADPGPDTAPDIPAYTPPALMDLIAPPRAEEPAEEETPLERTARTVLADGVRRIAGEVRNSLEFHLNADPALTGGGAAAAEAERLVLSGAAAGVAGLPERLGELLSLPVELPALHGADAADFTIAAGLCVEEAPA